MRVLPLVICLVTVRAARSEPTLLLDRCPGFDRVTLRAAIDRELAATRDRIRSDLKLVVECRDPLTVRLVVEGPQFVLEHGLDLGEVETELRPKLLLLSVVELVKVASAPRSSPGKQGGQQIPGQGPGHQGPGQQIPGGQGGRPAVPSGVTVTTPNPTKPAPVRVARVEPAVRVDAAGVDRSKPDQREPRVLAVAPRAGVRVFADEPVPLAHLAIDLEWWRFSLGIAGSVGAADDTLGTLRPYLATVAASAQLSCLATRRGRDRACLRIRGELGLAGVTARAANTMVEANNARAFYGQLGLGIEAEHVFGSLATMIAVDAGWAEGLVVTAQSRTPVRLDGPAITTVIGVRWRR